VLRPNPRSAFPLDDETTCAITGERESLAGMRYQNPSVIVPRPLSSATLSRINRIAAAFVGALDLRVARVRGINIARVCAGWIRPFDCVSFNFQSTGRCRVVDALGRVSPA